MRPRHRRGQGGRLSAEILAAATELLDNGCTVTFRAVAREAGIAPPSIYPHFPSQPALVLAVAQQSSADLVQRLRSVATGDPRQRLTDTCQAYLDYAHEYPRRYRVILTPDTEVLRLFTSCLAACAVSGHSTTQDPAADAIALWLGLHGLAHQRAVTGFFAWPADIAHRVATPLARLDHTP